MRPHNLHFHLKGTMSVLKPRTRQLYFRVSEEEFKRFRDIQTNKGARSLSDLFRNSLERLEAEENGRDGAINGTLETIQVKLAGLEAKLERLTSALHIGERDGTVIPEYGDSYKKELREE